MDDLEVKQPENETDNTPDSTTLVDKCPRA